VLGRARIGSPRDQRSRSSDEVRTLDTRRKDADLLVLDYVVSNPRWRGLKLGLLAVRKMVDLSGGGCGLVVSHIAPLRRDAHRMLRVPKVWLPRRGPNCNG
jgi:hypothetical protein